MDDMDLYQITKSCIVCDVVVLSSELTFEDCVCMACYDNRCFKCGEILSEFDKDNENKICDVCCYTVKSSSTYCDIDDCFTFSIMDYLSRSYCAKHYDELMIRMTCKHNRYRNSCYQCCNRCLFYCINCEINLHLRGRIIAIYIIMRRRAVPRFIANYFVNAIM